MNLKKMKYLFLLMMSVFMLASCSEDDSTVDEYANWQQRNEKAFADTLAYAKQKGEANGWLVLRNWSLENQTPNKDAYGNDVQLTYKAADNIIVHVLEKGVGTTSPIISDSVKVSYRGRLIGTDTYPEGYVFDQNFSGSYDKTTAQLSKFACKDVVDGFTTALLKMHQGDRWMVYIPYQLGYGTTQSSSSTIPACSMLRFEIVLDSFWHPGETMPDSK